MPKNTLEALLDTLDSDCIHGSQIRSKPAESARRKNAGPSRATEPPGVEAGREMEGAAAGVGQGSGRGKAGEVVGG